MSVFDFKDKKFIRNKFKKTDFFFIRSEGMEEKDVREVPVKEYLCAGNISMYLGWNSNQKEAHKRFIDAFSLFTVGINVKGVYYSFTFDKSEKRNSNSLKNALVHLIR